MAQYEPPDLWVAAFFTILQAASLAVMAAKHSKLRKGVNAGPGLGNRRYLYLILLMHLYMYPLVVAISLTLAWIGRDKGWWTTWLLFLVPLVIPVSFFAWLCHTLYDHIVPPPDPHEVPAQQVGPDAGDPSVPALPAAPQPRATPGAPESLPPAAGSPTGLSYSPRFASVLSPSADRPAASYASGQCAAAASVPYGDRPAYVYPPPPAGERPVFSMDAGGGLGSDHRWPDAAVSPPPATARTSSGGCGWAAVGYGQYHAAGYRASAAPSYTSAPAH
eukprot:TRINITY_DN25965_c0_g1_i1.p1 TRINITY_DN25965_c0_g1~~TRINITY_DN25965_c0_g1_i1.p1  ORF type:complete len:302 (+),score=51.31 TRINITY_DN25965_c0_g1_i1:81-908(+)